MMDIPKHIFQDLVNWDSLGKTGKEAMMELNIFMTKWISKETAT